MIRMTIAVPEPLIPAANQLARCLGQSAADGLSFGAVAYQNGAGQLYALASGLVQADFIEKAFAPLVAPPWGADMAAAFRAQEALRLCPPEAEDPLEMQAGPEVISVHLGEGLLQKIALMGLVAL